MIVPKCTLPFRTSTGYGETPLSELLTSINDTSGLSEPVGHVSDFINDTSDLSVEGLSKERLLHYAGRDTFPIPATADREGYTGNAHGQFWLNGLRDYFSIKKSCDSLNINLDNARVIDLGGATGRVLRHIVSNHKNVDAYIAELNRKHVEWIRKHAWPKIKAFQNTTFPHLPFEDDSVDLVTAFSVFTHVDYHAEALILEIRRLLRPGGLAYLTIHSEDTWRTRNGTLVHLLKEYPGYNAFSEQNPVDLPVPYHAFRLNNNPYLCMVFQTHEWTQKNWGAFFSSCKIIDRMHGTHAVVLLTK